MRGKSLLRSALRQFVQETTTAAVPELVLIRPRNYRRRYRCRHSRRPYLHRIVIKRQETGGAKRALRSFTSATVNAPTWRPSRPRRQSARGHLDVIPHSARCDE